MFWTIAAVLAVIVIALCIFSYCIYLTHKGELPMTCIIAIGVSSFIVLLAFICGFFW